MTDARRLSFDSKHTELVYYVTLNSKPVPPARLMELSSLLSTQEIALTLMEEVDERHIVEPYSASFPPSIGKSSLLRLCV